MLGINFSSPILATASNCKTQCKEVIQKCDKALSDKNKAIKSADKVISTCKEQNGKLITQVKEKDEDLNKWYRNPFVVGLLGIAVGLSGGLLIPVLFIN